jgi:hypothetical protein
MHNERLKQPLCAIVMENSGALYVPCAQIAPLRSAGHAIDEPIQGLNQISSIAYLQP